MCFFQLFLRILCSTLKIYDKKYIKIPLRYVLQLCMLCLMFGMAHPGEASVFRPTAWRFAEALQGWHLSYQEMDLEFLHIGFLVLGCNSCPVNNISMLILVTVATFAGKIKDQDPKEWSFDDRGRPCAPTIVLPRWAPGQSWKAWSVTLSTSVRISMVFLLWLYYFVAHFCICVISWCWACRRWLDSYGWTPSWYRRGYGYEREQVRTVDMWIFDICILWLDTTCGYSYSTRLWNIRKSS